MKVNLNNIRDTYGDSVVLLIRDNIDDVMKHADENMYKMKENVKNNK